MTSLYRKAQTLVFRADANTQIGSGHMMRCMALADHWQKKAGQAIFIACCDNKALKLRLKKNGFGLVQLEKPYPDPSDLTVTKRVLQDYPDAWIVLDGYHFDTEYQMNIRESGQGVFVIDDMAHLQRYCADAILNQNIYADRLKYSYEPDTHFLVGLDYALLRSEFLKWQGWKRKISATAHKVLVTMGGGDPNNQTLKAIRAISRMNRDDLETLVVVGGANPHYDNLVSIAKELLWPIRLVRDPSDMSQHMAWADIAIIAGGSTCLEVAYMGLPAIVIVLFDNQQRIAEGFDQAGVFRNLGWYHTVSEDQIVEALSSLVENNKIRMQMRNQAHQLVDGLGAGRVIDYLLKTSKF